MFSRFVRFTEKRLAKFQIGISNEIPTVNPPNLDADSACATIDDHLKRGELRKWIDCSGTGQYVVVQLMVTNYLTLCELEVYGYCKSPLYRRWYTGISLVYGRI